MRDKVARKFGITLKKNLHFYLEIVGKFGMLLDRGET